MQKSETGVVCVHKVHYKQTVLVLKASEIIYTTLIYVQAKILANHPEIVAWRLTETKSERNMTVFALFYDNANHMNLAKTAVWTFCSLAHTSLKHCWICQKDSWCYTGYWESFTLINIDPLTSRSVCGVVQTVIQYI